MKILYVTQILDEGTGYTVICQQVLQSLSHTDEVKHYPFDSESLEPWAIPHLIQPYETLLHDTDKFRELVEWCDLMFFQMPLMGGRPPPYLMNSPKPKVFVLHDILMYCSNFGVNTYTRQPCTIYEASETKRCFNCNDYMGAFVAESFNKMYIEWEQLMAQPQSIVISPSEYIKSAYIQNAAHVNEKIQVLPHPIMKKKVCQVEARDTRDVLIPSFSEFKTNFALTMNVIRFNPEWYFHILCDRTKISPITYDLFNRLANVEFIQPVPWQEMPDIYAVYPYVLHTSMAQESYGLVVGEAMQQNCKVFLNGRGAIPEWAVYSKVIWLEEHREDLDLNLLLQKANRTKKKAFTAQAVNQWCQTIKNMMGEHCAAL